MYRLSSHGSNVFKILDIYSINLQRIKSEDVTAIAGDTCNRDQLVCNLHVAVSFVMF